MTKEKAKKNIKNKITNEQAKIDKIEYEARLRREEIDKLNQKLNEIDNLIFANHSTTSSGGFDAHYLHKVSIEGICSGEEWDRAPKFNLSAEKLKYFAKNYKKYHSSVRDYFSNESREKIKALILVAEL